MDTAAASPELEPKRPAPESFFATEHLAGNVERRTMRGGALTVAYQIGKQVVSIGQTAIMSRLIMPADSGLIGMVVVVTGFIALFNDLGLSAATVQRETLDQRQVSALFWINVAMGVLLGLVTALAAPLLAWFYAEPRLLLVTLAIALGFVFGGVTVQHRALLKRQMRFDALVRIDIATTLVGVTAAITAAALLPPPLRYWALVIELLIQAPVEIVGLWIACRWRPSWPARAAGLRPMLAFGGNLTGFRLVNYLARNADNLLIGKLFGAAALGLYAKAYGLLLLPLRRVTDPFNTVATPGLSRLNDQPERYRAFYMQLSSLVCLLTMPLVALMIGASDWIIGVVLAPEWAGVSLLFALLGVSGLIEPLSVTTGWLFVSQGRTAEQLRWGFVSTGLLLSAIVFGLQWGPAGVAASYGVTGLLIRTPLLFWFVGRRGPVRAGDLYRNVAPFALASAAMLLALGAFRLWAATPSDLVNLLVAAPLAGLTGLATLAALPSGRAALRHAWDLPELMGMRRRRAKEAV